MARMVDATESVARRYACTFCNRENLFRTCSKDATKAKEACLSGILS
jgi:hypothetical protein